MVIAKEQKQPKDHRQHKLHFASTYEDSEIVSLQDGAGLELVPRSVTSFVQDPLGVILLPA